MKGLVRILVVAIALGASAALAQTPDSACLAKFYRAKSEACLNEALAALRGGSSDKSEINFAMVGFLAGVIQSSPAMEAKIVAADGPTTMKTTILLALDRAGHGEAARLYALTADLASALAALQSERPPRLADVRPRSAAADNALLIGAFMATGDATYIRAILANFADANDGQIGDAARVGLMQARFEDSDPRGGYRRLARVVCAKYACRRDMAAFSRVLTLSSAYRALDSLAADDEIVRQTRQDFLKVNPRVQAIERDEQEAFSNYCDLFAVWTAAKGDPDSTGKAKLEQALSAYENLGPARSGGHPLVDGP